MQPISFYNCQQEWPNQKDLAWSRYHDTGPLDLIGDVHGCYPELCQLLTNLGYQVDAKNWTARPPEGRKLVFLGDLCDRGPQNVNVLRLALELDRQGDALFVTGNHDEALWLNLHARPAPGIIGIEPTLREIAAAPDASALSLQVAQLLAKGSPYYVLDQGRLIVVHAGFLDETGFKVRPGDSRQSGYFDDAGPVDRSGVAADCGSRPDSGFPPAPAILSAAAIKAAEDVVADTPVKIDPGQRLIVYGHYAYKKVRQNHNWLGIDTGCVFGNLLTALRYPEGEIVSVPAHHTYYQLPHDLQ